MIARFTGAILGLLAFSVAALGGLWAGNPVTVTLSRAIAALILFCVLGLMVGGAAQIVVNHHAQVRLAAVQAGTESPTPVNSKDEIAGVGHTAELPRA